MLRTMGKNKLMLYFQKKFENPTINTKHMFENVKNTKFPKPQKLYFLTQNSLFIIQIRNLNLNQNQNHDLVHLTNMNLNYPCPG